MTHDGELHAGDRGNPRADTEVFYMAGRQLAKLGRRRCSRLDAHPRRRLCVVSRAGWPDQLCSTHTLAQLAEAALRHAGRPTVVIVGAGATVAAAPHKAPQLDQTQASVQTRST